MNWCWQQDPELRPTASEVVEAVKSEEFCCLINGVCINDYGKVLCVHHHTLHTANYQEARETLNKDNVKPEDSVAILQSENSFSASKNTTEYEIWISSSNNIQSSMVTVLDYSGKFTTIEVSMLLYTMYVYETVSGKIDHVGVKIRIPFND